MLLLLILIAVIAFLVKEIILLEEKIAILETERSNTRKVMYENGLIPKEYVK